MCQHLSGLVCLAAHAGRLRKLLRCCGSITIAVWNRSEVWLKTQVGRSFWILVLVMALAVIMQLFISGRPYPDCNDSAALAELARLYDNRRLLHAVDVSDARLLRDGMTARYCAVRITWGDGSETSVKYEFDRSGGARGQAAYPRMWIDYNGGMHGPSF